MDSDLKQTIGELYGVFSRYRVPNVKDHCTHCVTDEEAAAIRTTRLTDLTGQDLNRYAWKAMSTWGGMEEFKHFLPRLLELAAVGELIFPSSLMTKVGAVWRDWPDEEQSAIQAFVEAWWASTVRDHPSPVPIQEMLEIIEFMGFGLRPSLEVWARTGTSGAARHIAELINRIPNVDQQQELQRWLGEPAVGTLLTDIAATAEPDLASEVAQALEGHHFWRTYQH
ncbi:hypothetical protein [Actinomadura rudentiformis]|uniref:Uncharacterized protein n=1 Tax=Actinomadura rudentiformis TaxID=359158 RepID=A0A6H9YTS2_9ACTN|nr:hypothetical protein [Actinomadura rudentiformis]KAB2347743.1 hypothetical protein F8566_17695 [Actinomadura rudentiformis]